MFGILFIVTSLVEQSKKKAAEQCIDEEIKNHMIIGIGSGSTIVYAIQHLSKRIKSENLTITCIPTSFQSKQLLHEHNISQSTLDFHSQLDIAIDGADEVDSSGNCIKGGGACMLQEKIIASW